MRSALAPMIAAAVLWTGVATIGLGAGSAHAAPARAVAGDLKTAHANVDKALALRTKRFEAWKKAAAQRDRAAADVTARKRAGAPKEELEGAMRKALQQDEQAAKARTQLLAAEADVTAGGNELLRLYDALLTERRLQAEAMGQNDPARAAAASAYNGLREQRDNVRRALLPVLAAQDAPASVGADAVDLDPRANDDVEALLEKADLARDLEDRAQRQAAAVRKRITELEESAGVQRGVSGMVLRGNLFDETDRHLPVTSRNLQTAGATTLSGAQPKATSPALAEDGAAPGDPVVDTEGTTPPTPLPSPSRIVSEEPVQPLASAEQAFAGPQTDSAIASLVSSSSVSLDQLRALEKKLKTDAARMRDKSVRLKAEAETRARD